MTRVHLRITGRVQGVYYRVSAQQEAGRLGLMGWVRNRRDGSVELVAEGTEEAVAILVAWCRRGPDGAVVQDVDVISGEPVGTLDGFQVRPTQ